MTATLLARGLAAGHGAKVLFADLDLVVAPGDVVGLMCHAERQEVYDWLASVGATSDGPAELAAKVRAAATGEQPTG